MFFDFLAADESGDRSPWGDFWFQPVPGRSSSSAGANPDAAMRLTAVYSCVRILSEGVAMLPFTLASMRDDGGRDLVTDHPVYRVFARRPNRFQNPFEFREMMQGHLCLRGNAYGRNVFDGAGDLAEILPFHPDRVMIDRLDNGSWRYRVKKLDGTGEEILQRDEMFHVRGLSSDGIVGINPIALAREAVGIGLAAQSYGARFFDNDATPGGWISSTGKFATTEDKRKFRESWQEVQGGMNRGKTAVLELGMEYHQLELKNSDAQFLETRKFQVTEIARLFRIPPHMVGDLERATFSNIEQQSIEYVMHALTPWLCRWEEAIEFNFLDPDVADVELDVEFPVTELLRGDAAARATFYGRGILDGWMVRNEARIREGMNPVEGLDRPLLPLNMVTIKPDGTIDTSSLPQKPAATTPPAAAQRAMLLATAAAERIARKEIAMAKQALAKERAKAGPPQLEPAYTAHAEFVASALQVTAARATEYCIAQVALLRDKPDLGEVEFEALTRSRLERLALGENE